MPTETRAVVTRGPSWVARTLRLWLLALIAADLALMALRVVTYPAFFAMPGAAGYLIPLLVGLAICATAIATLPRLAGRAPGAATALRVGTIAGLVGGALDIANIAL